MKEQKDRYEIFLKVCETGSFSKAAEALNYTQSGISQMMAGLEEELGVKLFRKQGRNVVLTKYGRFFLGYVEESMNVLELGVSKTKGMAGQTKGVHDPNAFHIAGCAILVVFNE